MQNANPEARYKNSNMKNSFKFIIGKSGKWINFKLCGREKIHAPGANPNSTVPLEPLVN